MHLKSIYSIYMYLCMHGLHVCMYVCWYVCINCQVGSFPSMYVYRCMYVCTYIHVCMYV